MCFPCLFGTEKAPCILEIVIYLSKLQNLSCRMDNQRSIQNILYIVDNFNFKYLHAYKRSYVSKTGTKLSEFFYQLSTNVLQNDKFTLL